MQADCHILRRQDFGSLIEALQNAGYSVVGPTARDGAIIYDTLESVADLPVGKTDAQEPGRYRLNDRPDAALFGYNLGPHSWKKYLYPPSRKLLAVDRLNGQISARCNEEPVPKLAFLGVRACELHAIAIQDKVLLHGAYASPAYRRRRERSCIIAVNCTQAGGTCFCSSMKTGPQAGPGYDLALTEQIDARGHWFLVRAATVVGQLILAGLPYREAEPDEIAAADTAVQRTAQSMGRTLKTTGIREMLNAKSEHPRWVDLSERCLACANCTLVCPTCFCTRVEEVNDLTGNHAERWQKWDSCFTMDYARMRGGAVRPSTSNRYRQWLTHKLATWHDQFGSSGCVGCGRCITWCPVGIDLTAEVAVIGGKTYQAGPVLPREV